MSAKMPKSMIETNEEYGAGRVEPEKEKNPPQENEELYEQNHENDLHQVEHEKNPEQEKVREDVEEYVDTSAFNGRLFSRRYKYKGSNDILQAGQQYKSKIRETVQEDINRCIRFYIVYEVKLENY